MSQLTKQETQNDVVAEHTQDAAQYTPRFDVWESEEEVVLYGDVPRVKAKDLDIHFEKGELTLHAKAAPRQTDATYLYGEYGVGDFYRSFSISETIDAEKIHAELKNGVLALHLPKSESVKPRRIEVKSD